MKTFALMFLLVGVFASLCLGQPPDSLWSRTFGGIAEDVCKSVQQTSDGGYILAGHTNSFGVGTYTYANFWLLKTDADGDSLWSRTYGGSGSDYCSSVQQTWDGGYILGGYTYSFGIGTPAWANFWVVKTNGDGDSLWSRIFGGSNQDPCQSVQQTSDSGYILAGSTHSFVVGYYSDFWLVKTDANGDSLWSRTFGGSEDEECYSVQQTSDGGYILGGYTASFGAGRHDFWLVKTDADGDSLWSRTFGGTRDEWCSSVQQTSEGGYILAGYTFSFGVGTPVCANIWLVKTNANGDSLWSRTFGGNDYEFCYSVQQTSDDGYILGGTTSSYGMGVNDFWLVKTRANGDSLWSRTFGGVYPDEAYSARQTSDGGYILGGYATSLGAGYKDFWLVKTGPERPYDATVYINEAGTSPVLRWIAPRTCDYLIYTSTDMGSDLDPPGPTWSIEATLSNVPAGSASWTDPAGIVNYKRYSVTMSCP